MKPNTNVVQTNPSQEGIIDLMVRQIKTHKKALLITGAAVLLVVCGFYAYQYQVNKKYQEQWSKLFLAELDFVSSGNGSLSAMENYAKQYAATPAGAYANFVLGNAYYQAQKYSEAQSAFEQTVKYGAKEIADIASISLIATQIAAQKYEEALSGAETFIAQNPTYYSMGQVHQYKALAQELSGKKQDAKATYQQIKESYPDTYYSVFAEMRLNELS